MKCRLDGDLTIGTAAEVKGQLLQALAGEGPLELDTSAVSEVDAAGMQVLLAAFKSAASAKAPIRFPVEARGPAVNTGLTLLGLAAHDWTR